ncbi:hypothetical protein VTO42DRAFT_8907 [Malbranchea cinnamomea]
MLSAFSAQPLVELRQRDKSKIESLLAYGDRLLVGLNTGTLRIYRVNEVPDQDAETAEQQQQQQNTAQNENATTDDTTATPSSAPKVKPTDLLREQEKFARYKIEQLALIKEANLLISLSGGYVSLHDLHSYELQEQLVRTKGATTFAVTSNIVRDEASGVPSIVSRLAVAVKRKVVFWTWRDMELEVGEDEADGAGAGAGGIGPAGKEITLVSGIKTLTWATGTKILAGLGSGYVLVDVVTGEVTDIIGPGSIGGVGGAEGGRLGGVSVASMSYIGMGGTAPKPLATRLREGEMLLAKDVNTHFIDTDGKPLGRRQIPWNTAPEAVGYSYPYLLALQEPSKGILEVRNPETLSLLQSISLPSASHLHIPQPNISLAHAGKGFLVASERVIWRMNALDYDSQIDSLVDEGYLDEAISLLEILEEALLTDKKGRLREVKLRKAKRLFDQRKYRKSLDLFTEVSTPPELVIRLYPKVIAGDLSSFGESENDQEDTGESGDDAPQKATGSPEATGAEAAPPEDRVESRGVGYAPSIRSFIRRRTDTWSETSSIRAKTPEVKGPDKRLQGKDLKDAVYELQGFLADIRRRLQRYLNPDGTPKTSRVQLNGESDEFTQSVLNTLGMSNSAGADDLDFGTRLREVATLVDTTLFRAHMYATPSLAGSLFRITNFCDPDVVMEKLEETGRYNDLIDFLFGKKLHRPALEHLRRFGEQGQSQEEQQQQTSKKTPTPPQLLGPSRTIAYLQHLPPSEIDLILEFAEWPLRTDPELGMEIFLADTENAETLPRERVLEFLTGIDKRLAIRYLEHVIGELNDMTPELHQRLLMLYLEKLLSPAVGEEVPDGERASFKVKFLDMLKISAQYSPAKMLDRLPRDDPEFYEARAIIFSKMGQHRQALEIYVFKLNDHKKAEEYCNQIHLQDDTTATLSSPQTHHQLAPSESEADSHPSIYHTLLSLYLSPPHGYDPQYGPALEILARHGSRLPAGSTLELIPETLPVADLEFYFRNRIRAANTIMNESRVVAALRKVQSMKAEAKLALGEAIFGGGGANQGRNRFVTVSEDRVCGVCHKRLGGSVISVFPDNGVVHLGCANKRTMFS